jgi:hypothetical protein
MSAHELANQLATANPGKRFAVSAKGDGVAMFCESIDRFHAIAENTITGQWVRTEFECLVNGQRIERNWQELDAKAEGGAR